MCGGGQSAAPAGLGLLPVETGAILEAQRFAAVPTLRASSLPPEP
jgi:hypothetical protein